MGVCLFFALPAFGGESALLFGPYDWNGPALLFGVGLRVGFGVISGGGGDRAGGQAPGLCLVFLGCKLIKEMCTRDLKELGLIK